jgi:hypothetical protein
MTNSGAFQVLIGYQFHVPAALSPGKKQGIHFIRGLCESQRSSGIFGNKENASGGIRTPGHEDRSIDAILHSLPRVFLQGISLTKCHRRNVLNVSSEQITNVPTNMRDVTENQKEGFPYTELWLVTVENLTVCCEAWGGIVVKVLRY